MHRNARFRRNLQDPALMRAIAATVDVPVIADIDTGFGNAVNVSYVVPQYEAAGASAVVMEDKIFPKDTSLRTDGGIHAVDAALPTVRDIIGLQGDADMRELERRFLR